MNSALNLARIQRATLGRSRGVFPLLLIWKADSVGHVAIALQSPLGFKSSLTCGISHYLGNINSKTPLDRRKYLRSPLDPGL